MTALSAREDDCDHLPVADPSHCPACFDRQLYSLDAGFLESYRRFGSRTRIVVAETCLRALTLENPERRKILAMTIFEQYVLAVTDLAAMFTALRDRGRAPVMRSFLDFRLDPAAALDFFESVQSASDVELRLALGLPLPYEIASRCPHLSPADVKELGISMNNLVRDLRKATDQGAAGALLLAEVAGQINGAVISNDASWLDSIRNDITPDKVAMLAMDSRRRLIQVQPISAEEKPLAEVVDAIDTVTRASGDLVYAYLQTYDL